MGFQTILNVCTNFRKLFIDKFKQPKLFCNLKEIAVMWIRNPQIASTSTNLLREKRNISIRNYKETFFKSVMNMNIRTIFEIA